MEPMMTFTDTERLEFLMNVAEANLLQLAKCGGGDIPVEWIMWDVSDGLVMLSRGKTNRETIDRAIVAWNAKTE